MGFVIGEAILISHLLIELNNVSKYTKTAGYVFGRTDAIRAIYFGVYDTVKPILERHSQTKIGFIPR